jgi:putative FmdB family regulatory protein
MVTKVLINLWGLFFPNSSCGGLNMPIYEYHCKSCKKTFEVFQKITDEPLKKCKDCGGKVERLISETSFSLKGGGWYKDGYSSTSGKKKEKSNSKDKK